jgi:preprotein translocase subunit SecD
MLPRRTVPAALLLTGLALAAPLLAGCSSSSSGASPSGSAGVSARRQDPLASASPPAATDSTGSTTGKGTGSTTATYRAAGADGTAPGTAEVQRTADRLRARLAAFGLTGATVAVSGTTLTVTAAGDATDALRQVAVPADLAFRPVLAGTGVPADVQRAYQTLDCAAPAAGVALSPAAPDRPTAACDRKLHQKYLLGPVALTGADVAKATAVNDAVNGNGWMVDLGFTSAGSAKFATVTGALAAQPPPADQFAILLDGEVLSAPAVREAITGGRAQISGTFTADSARHLAALIASGALPVRLTVNDVTKVP